MYFPYLRGKQFELLALRDLVPLPLDSTKIIPIIEPIKKGLKSLSTALKALNQIDVKVQLIVNPQFGELVGKTRDIITFIEEQRESGISNIIPTFLVHSDRDVDLIISYCKTRKYDTSGYALVHLNQIGKVEELSKYANATACLFNTIMINYLFALKRKLNSETISLLSDSFKKQRVNADYAIDVDEVFSSDYFFYGEEGCIAFSDYQSIGAGYVEGGMLPRAVAIHLTYKDPNADEIRIIHFVSDNNDGISDIAGKFYEALSKLIIFADQQKLDTRAIQIFRDYHARQAFPGLGTIKKLSIMHHIELIQGLI